MQFKCELQKEKSKFMNELAQIKYCNQLDIEELRNQIVRLKEEKDFQEKLWERKIREGKEAESRGLEENSLKIKSMEETCR